MGLLTIRSTIAVIDRHLRLRHLHYLEECRRLVLNILVARPPRKEALHLLYLQPEDHGLRHNKHYLPSVAESRLQHHQSERHHLLGRSLEHHPPWLMLGSMQVLRHRHFLEGHDQARISSIQGHLRHPGHRKRLWMKASKLHRSSMSRRLSKASDISLRHLPLLPAALLFHLRRVYREKSLMGMLYLLTVQHPRHYHLRPRVQHRHLQALRHHLLCRANGILLPSSLLLHRRPNIDLCQMLRLCLRDRPHRPLLHPCHQPHGPRRHLLCLPVVGHLLRPYHPCAAH